jgi:hypothetical protein
VIRSSFGRPSFRGVGEGGKVDVGVGVTLGVAEGLGVAVLVGADTSVAVGDGSESGVSPHPESKGTNNIMANRIER